MMPVDEKTIPLSRMLVKPIQSDTEINRSWDSTLSYRTLFEQTGECIFIIGLDFHYITANQQALDLLGYEEEELVNKPVDEVVTQEATPNLNDEVTDDNSIHLQERILKRKDGTSIPVEISTTVVYDDDGQPTHIQSVARDISIRKRSEQTLKRNALILSIISNATAKLLQSSDIEKNIPFLLEALGNALNISCCVIFSLDDFSGPPVAQIRYQWSRSNLSNSDISIEIEPRIPQILDGNSLTLPSVRAERPGDEISRLSFVTIKMDGAFSSKGYLGFFENGEKLPWSQTEMDALRTAANLINAALQRKQYEETIRLSEARNRIIVDALPDLIIRVDIDGIVLDYSANPDHPLYIHRELACGRQLNKTFPDEIVAQIFGEENLIAFVTPQKVEEFRLPYALGTYEASLYPIDTDEALILVRDVTEQVKLNEMKSDFINRASHELRTPLTSAMLMVELIQEGGTPDEMENCWKTLKRELYRQKELIDHLLMAGRLESGMIGIDARAIDLLPILRESMQSVQPIIAKRNISLKLHHDKEISRLWGDTGGLQQVFINLINNAAKFSPEGSTINIRVSQNDTHVKISIVDKGVGIPQEAIPHLFERFYRAKNVTIAEIPGSGIGLYIVNSIVSELGGNIDVKSIPNKGTTFTVYLKRSTTDD